MKSKKKLKFGTSILKAEHIHIRLVTFNGVMVNH